MSEKSSHDMFELNGKVVVITGGAGLLGKKHAEVVAEYGGIPVLVDINKDKNEVVAKEVEDSCQVDCFAMAVDITQPSQVCELKDEILARYGSIDVLVNNAANNPAVSNSGLRKENASRLEFFPLDVWGKDISVGLTGAFICTQILGAFMAKNGGGVIVNIASDLALISPDQRLYQKPNIPDDLQVVKPVTYSVVKSGLIGLTRYTATYWADKGVRCNALSPGGVFADQEEEFVSKLTQLIPMGRMADISEYKASLIFLISDASSYMNGANLVVDGGRTVW